MVGATILPKYFSAAANSGIHALSYNSDSRSSKEDGGRGAGRTRKFKKVPFQKDKYFVTGKKNSTDTNAKISTLETKYFNIVP